MTKQILYLLLAAMMMFFLVQPAAAQGPAGEKPQAGSRKYVVGSGDVLLVTVWQNKDLTQKVRVLPDGNISLPLVGEVQAAGKTVAALEGELKEKITPYMPEPLLFVTVLDADSMVFYVIGRVNNPGQFPLKTDITVFQALAMARGLTPYAESDEIRLYRKERGETVIIDFPYDDIAKGRGLELNIPVRRGDLIYVP